jgi:hypothetical protein
MSLKFGSTVFTCKIYPANAYMRPGKSPVKGVTIGASLWAKTQPNVTDNKKCENQEKSERMIFHYLSSFFLRKV